MLKTTLIAAALTAAILASTPADVRAVDVDTTPQANAESADFVAARRAIERKNWKEASTRLQRVVAAEPGNADAHNLLGYALRWQNDLPGALASYERALKINPQHRGALEYAGVALIRSGQRARAEENLAKLKEICGVNCEEYRDLARALAAAPR